MNSNSDISEKSSAIKQFFEGKVFYRWIIRLWPFIVMLLLMALFMNLNRDHAEKVIRKISSVRDSISALHTQSVAIESELLQMSGRSVIIDRINSEGLDLIDPKEPPRRLTVKKLTENEEEQ
ncbi:MAG: hypothetical protein LBR06_03135 [Bacteroidales bacterium]|jgi:cell division protein FtsL|nr:hypothetical protein [Bacteroidales bacterium]